jgi:hypothetical protein
MANVRVTRLRKPKMVSVRIPEDNVEHFDKLADSANMSRTEVISQVLPQLLDGSPQIEIINRKTGFQFFISKPITGLTDEDYTALREECSAGESVASEEKLEALDEDANDAPDDNKSKETSEEDGEETQGKGFKF